MILKNHDQFFIQWDIVYELENNPNLGIFNFWIDNICYPAQGINITLPALFWALICNIESIDGLKKDLTDIPISKINFSDIDNDKLVFLDTGELFQYGFGLVLGFNQDQERIFYTTDFEKTYSEIILPKGVLRATLNSLLLNMDQCVLIKLDA